MKSISDHVLDISQNSVTAKATLIEIIVEEDKKNDLYTLVIKDNGCGMDRETLRQAANPFFTSRKTRKVGMGLSLLKQNAEAAGGRFTIGSEVGKGTEVEAVFQLSHLDRPPLGDIWDTWYLTVLANPAIRFIYRHHTPAGNFVIDSDELINLLKGVSLQQRDVKRAVIEMIKNNLVEIESGK